MFYANFIRHCYFVTKVVNYKIIKVYFCDCWIVYTFVMFEFPNENKLSFNNCKYICKITTLLTVQIQSKSLFDTTSQWTKKKKKTEHQVWSWNLLTKLKNTNEEEPSFKCKMWILKYYKYLQVWRVKVLLIIMSTFQH